MLCSLRPEALEWLLEVHSTEFLIIIFSDHKEQTLLRISINTGNINAIIAPQHKTDLCVLLLTRNSYIHTSN